MSEPATYIVDTGCSDSTFPGYFDPEANKLYMKLGNIEGFREVDVPHWPNTNVVFGGNSSVQSVLRDFTLKFDGKDGDFKIPLKRLDAPYHVVSENLLGMDALSQMTGCWTSVSGGGTVLNLELLPQKAQSNDEGVLVTFAASATTAMSGAAENASNFASALKDKIGKIGDTFRSN